MPEPGENGRLSDHFVAQIKYAGSADRAVQHEVIALLKTACPNSSMNLDGVLMIVPQDLAGLRDLLRKSGTEPAPGAKPNPAGPNASTP